MIRVTRNPDYWKHGYPYLDGIEYGIIPNLATRILGFVAGKFDDIGLDADAAMPCELRQHGAHGRVRVHDAMLRFGQAVALVVPHEQMVPMGPSSRSNELVRLVTGLDLGIWNNASRLPIGEVFAHDLEEIAIAGQVTAIEQRDRELGVLSVVAVTLRKRSRGRT